MPAINPGDQHIDSLLTNLLIGFKPEGMIGDVLFPVVNVQKQSGIYAKVDKGNWFRIPDTNRAPGTAPREVSYTVSSDTYFAPNYELATTVAWETIDNADVPHRPLQRSAELVQTNLLLDFEQRVATTAWAGVGASATKTGTAAWNDLLNSDPLSDYETARETIRSTTGKKPNLCILPEKVLLKLRRHPDIVRAAYPGAGVGGLVTADQIGQILDPTGSMRVVVPGAIKNTSAPGQADAFSDVWSTSVILAYVDPNPSPMQPTFGLAFEWSGPNIGAGSPGGFAVQRRSDSKRKAEEIQMGYYRDEKIVASELGYLIATGITS